MKGKMMKLLTKAHCNLASNGDSAKYLFLIFESFLYGFDIQGVLSVSSALVQQYDWDSAKAKEER